MLMNTDTLHLAPKALRIAFARHIVAAAMAEHESDHGAHAEVEGGNDQADHDRAARVLRTKDAATNHDAPVQYPEVNDVVSRPAAADAAKPEAATSARTRSGRIYAAACVVWAAAAAREIRGGKSVAPSDTAFRTASPSNDSRRHSGMKSAFFQLSIVVSGKPVSRAISAEPPSASMI
jgi:hypothetical protein